MRNKKSVHQSTIDRSILVRLWIGRRRWWGLLLGLVLVGGLNEVVICLKQAGYHLIYSGTASMPKGFYWVVPVSDRLANGDLVEFSPPIVVRRFMIHKGWSNRELTLLKEVGATAGDSVCWQQGAVWINGQRRALIRKLPQDDRKFLPNLAGCIKLSPGWYLVLGTQSERSLDSRYFGIIPQTALRGRAIPLYIQQVGKSE